MKINEPIITIAIVPGWVTLLSFFQYQSEIGEGVRSKVDDWSIINGFEHNLSVMNSVTGRKFWFSVNVPSDFYFDVWRSFSK